MDTVKDVVAGTAGLSASLWGPKFLGHLVWAPLGRGYGSVVSSAVSTGVTSWLVGKASPRAARGVFIGGMIGTFAGLLSAIHCGWRSRLLPFESSHFACALPTVPPATPQAAMAANADVANKMVAAGVPPANVALATGMQGYGPMPKFLGLKDYVLAAGMRDYVSFPQNGGGQTNDAGSQGTEAGGGSNNNGSATMDASPEQF